MQIYQDYLRIAAIGLFSDINIGFGVHAARPLMILVGNIGLCYVVAKAIGDVARTRFANRAAPAASCTA